VAWKLATADAVDRLCLPDVDEDAVVGLKFSEAPPERLAAATLATRTADLLSAERVLGDAHRFSFAYFPRRWHAWVNPPTSWLSANMPVRTSCAVCGCARTIANVAYCSPASCYGAPS
jgi:hypothetical protein